MDWAVDFGTPGKDFRDFSEEQKMLGDGEHISQAINIGSMDDVGTRFKHLTELYELWLEGIDILDKWEKKNPKYKEKREELEHATTLLAFHFMKDYQDNADRSIINSLPLHGDDIPKT